MILDDVYDYLGRFIVYPNNHARVIHTLWIVHTHLIDAFDYTPRLCILSAEKRSGKSTLVKLTKVLSQKGEAFVNPNPANIYSIIDEGRQAEDSYVPTLCIDEQDRLWNRKETGDLIAIIDQGFEKDNDGVPRTRQNSITGKRTTDRFNTFCPVLLAGIETNMIPDTILDRSIVIRMKRRMSSESIERFRTRYKTQAIELRQKIEQWAKENIEKAKECIPDIPSDIDDRYGDICEPLFVVTNVTNVTDVTRWKEALVNAIKSYASKRAEDEPSRNILWLGEVRDIIGDKDRVSKQDIINQLESRLGMNRNVINSLIKKFDIPKDKPIRFIDKTERGWYSSDWVDVFSRYLETAVTNVTNVTNVTETVDSPDDDLEIAIDGLSDTNLSELERMMND